MFYYHNLPKSVAISSFCIMKSKVAVLRRGLAISGYLECDLRGFHPRVFLTLKPRDIFTCLNKLIGIASLYGPVITTCQKMKEMAHDGKFKTALLKGIY